MPLSWNEIRERALAFSNTWADESSERAEAKTFWDDFFNVFGLNRRRVASFEQHVKSIDGRDGYIDLLWRGVLLVEHKSRGKNLTSAHHQALAYFKGLVEADLPRYVLVSDFHRFRLTDLDSDEVHEFTLPQLNRNVQMFGFIAGYRSTRFREEDPVNLEAAERMGLLHDKLLEIGYSGHALEVYLVRLLFCLFAEDTGIFDQGQFQDYIETRTAVDGSDLAPKFSQLFEILNTPPERRLKKLDESAAAFQYINGRLFSESLPHAAFDGEMRNLLLLCCRLDWSRISPAIFGALFQSIMDKQRRRHLGAHYTSEKDILKLIEPLFLDDLKREFQQVRHSIPKLKEFHTKLAKLRFLDPACGCGNFLVIAYRELRELELEVLRLLNKNKTTQSLDVAQFQVQVNVDQFYGIEIEEFPAQIAQTALWLMDHQMNMKVSLEFGRYFARLPLSTSPTIVHGNALRLAWQDVVPASSLSFILGNPPFGGKQFQSAEQKVDLEIVFGDMPGAGVLDYVSAWYRKAGQFMEGNPSLQTAFVSTNSIVQGEQVAPLWRGLLGSGLQIDFAHRTFQWNSEARGKAAVHCVIVGFSRSPRKQRLIFDYETPQSEPAGVVASNINPYLIDAPNVTISDRTQPLCAVPKIVFGSMPNDGGQLLLTPEEREELLTSDPGAHQFLRVCLGSEEFLNGIKRYCLWLQDAQPNSIRALPGVLSRVREVQHHRLASQRETTRRLAETPALFGEIRQPKTEYLLIPSVSSERRKYIPIGFLPPSVVATNLALVIPDATLFHFGVLSSLLHMAWVRTVAGRLKSDFRYSSRIVYNNFPWPNSPTANQISLVASAAQVVLDARKQYRNHTLAEIYDPSATVPELNKAHHRLDAAVERAYTSKKLGSEMERAAFLFDLYAKYDAPLTHRSIRAKETRKN